MCPCEFEAKIQVGCVVELVKIARSGDALSQKSEVLKHAGCVVGCLGAYVEQFESPRPSVGAAELPDTVEGCCDAIENAMPEDTDGSEEGFRAINPIVLALILKLIEKLIAKYL